MSAADDARRIAQRRAARSSWVELEPGKRVQILRPPEMFALDAALGAGSSPSDLLPLICKYVVGWEGFTEVYLLGEGVGGSDPVEFSAGLWADVVADEAQWASKVFLALQTQIAERHKSREEIAKN